jgi:starch synthase
LAQALSASAGDGADVSPRRRQPPGLTRPAVALLPWGDVVEDRLDPAGLGLDGLRSGLDDDWVFGYARALSRAGARPAIIVVSRQLRQTAHWRHGPSGTPLVVLPQPRAARALLDRGVAEPSAGTRRRPALAGYAATPLRSLGAELRRLGAGALVCQGYESERFDACVALGRVLRIGVFGSFQGAADPSAGLERSLRSTTVTRADGLIIASAGEADRVRRA